MRESNESLPDSTTVPATNLTVTPDPRPPSSRTSFDSQPGPALVDAAASTYVAGQVLKHRRHHGQLQFRVRWRGYDEADDTWEPLDNLHVRNMPNRALLDFLSTHPRLRREVLAWSEAKK